MKSYDQIPGHMNFEDLYDEAISRAEPNDTLVEVGVLWGRSLAYLCERAAAVEQAEGKFLNIVGVDHWGAEDFRKFEEHLKDSAAWNRAAIMRSGSPASTRSFKDGELAFVFIDADHSFDGVKEDIAAWWPKVKPGGVLAGHDYSEADWPGVVKAVRERFGNVPKKGVAQYCWWVEK